MDDAIDVAVDTGPVDGDDEPLLVVLAAPPPVLVPIHVPVPVPVLL
jgi:hypothetical protein